MARTCRACGGVLGRCHPEVEKIVPIPADSLHKLIKEHTKKAK